MVKKVKASVNGSDKSWWQSKIVIVQVVMFVLGVLAIVQDLKVIDPKWLVAIGGVLTLVLRVWFSGSNLTK